MLILDNGTMLVLLQAPPSLSLSLLPPSFFLSFSQSKEKMKRGSRRAAIQLKGAIIGIDDEDDCTFTIRDQTRIFHFQGERQGKLPECVLFRALLSIKFVLYMTCGRCYIVCIFRTYIHDCMCHCLCRVSFISQNAAYYIVYCRLHVKLQCAVTHRQVVLMVVCLQLKILRRERSGSKLLRVVSGD